MVRHNAAGEVAILDVIRKIFNINSNHASALLTLVQKENKDLVIDKQRIHEFGKQTPVADENTMLKIIENCPKLRKRDNTCKVFKTRELLSKITRKKIVK